MSIFNLISPDYPAPEGYILQESELLDEEVDEEDDAPYDVDAEDHGYYDDHYRNITERQDHRPGSRSHDYQSPDLTPGEESEDTLQNNSTITDRVGIQKKQNKRSTIGQLCRRGQ